MELHHEEQWHDVCAQVTVCFCELESTTLDDAVCCTLINSASSKGTVKLYRSELQTEDRTKNGAP